MKKLLVLGTCGALLLAGCGTRADDAEIQAGAGGGTVSLSQQSIDELRAATGGAAANTGAALSAAPSGTTPTTPTGGATAPGTTTGTAPAASSGGATTATTTKGGTNPAATSGGKATTASTGCTSSGAPVNIGQVGTFSGVTGPAWAGGRASLAVWAKDVNARGGVACHPVVLHFADDGGDPARAASLVQEQVKNGTVAFVGGHDDLSIAGFKQGIETAKVPAVGGDAIAIEWNQSPYLFPQGAGIIDQIFGLMKQNVDAGAKKLGLLYCVEVAACAVANKAINQDGLAAKAGAQVVYNSAISLTQTDFTAQCQSAKNAGAEQLALGMDGSSMARVARSCAAVGYRPLFGGIGGTISPGQAEDPTLRQFTLSTATPTAPWTVFDNPGLKAYKAALDTYAPGEEPSGSSVQMWTAGKLFEAAVAKLGEAAKSKPLTAQMIIDGLHKIKNETLGGLTGPLTFPEGPAPSSGCVFYEKLTDKGWTAPRGSKPVCH
jgi:branched-chain amino acid transport system substrate-binding protein